MIHPVFQCAGRIFVALIFLGSGINKVQNFAATQTKMAEVGIPAPGLLLPLAILFLLVGSLSLILGFRVRIGSGLLIVFLILATLFFHDFWTFEGAARQMQQIQFMKNLGLLGGLLLVAANGPGEWSLEHLYKPTGRPKGTYDIRQAMGEPS